MNVLSSIGKASMLRPVLRSPRACSKVTPFNVNKSDTWLCFRGFSQALEKYKNLYFLESWTHDVHPYGRLLVKVPFNVKIVPIDPGEYPFQDKSFVHLYADPAKLPKGLATSQWKDLYKCHINTRLRDKEMDLLGVYTSEGFKQLGHGTCPIECLLQVPVKFGISVHTTEAGSVDICGMEGHSVTVTTHSGHCIIKDLKCGNIHAHSASGDITCRKGIVGNVDIGTKDSGKIKADKLQGQHIRLKTDNGAIRVKSIYCDTANVWTQTGNINLGSCHGNNIIESNMANVLIGSLDGNLHVNMNKGYIETNLIRHEDVNIKLKEGNICLQLPDDNTTKLNLEGSDVMIDMTLPLHIESRDDLGGKVIVKGRLQDGETGMVIACTKKGHIKIESKDWFSTMTHGFTD